MSESNGSKEDGQPQLPEEYLSKLLQEKQTLDQTPGFSLAQKLLLQEMERIQNGGRPPGKEDKKFADITKEKPIKVTVRVLVPVKEHPKFNFVGKLLGPKGNSLKRLQEETMTKMAILGRGSMRDKQKEEELRLSTDPKFSHLNEDLHVEVTAFAPPAEAHARIAYALAEIRKFLVPDYNDEIRQEQMREMQILNATLASAAEGAALVGGAASPTGASPLARKLQNGKSENLLMHPALRGLTRAQAILPGAGDTVFRNASILNRIRPAIPLARVATPASKRSILSLIGRARGGTIGEDVMETGEEAAAVYGLYDGYNGAAGFGLLENYANGNGLTTDDIEDVSQDGVSVNGAAVAAEFVQRPDAPGTLKVSAAVDRARFRHDPYGRFTAKLPL